MHVIFQFPPWHWPSLPPIAHAVPSGFAVWKALPSLHVSAVQSSVARGMSLSSFLIVGIPPAHRTILQSNAVGTASGAGPSGDAATLHTPFLHASSVQGFLSSH